ncbi:hypothetical protein SNE40_003467 [Patella caerulea]|uniref:Uncharacterized protein n=1 Tax=Patella caerulea TaxID=87958 RepID=A0AAN8K7Z9_PATCE
MGREQDLLDAARTGNVAVIEKLLTNRTRKSSGGGGLTSALASLWNLKSVNINCTDTSGETPLHLAALNGHREVVSILLQSEANPAAVDTRGCTPLHLAAWSGNSDICYMLLNPSAPATLSTVNLQNGDGDTPLHCAAQHGHATTVSILLQNKSDPAIRNLGDLTPLELAAQYGRLDVVIHLIKTHPGLVNHVVPTHTPLHLASRSGHLAVVEYLLNSGIQVNLKTDAGTALHEAATYCKVDVIQLLLERGIDVNIRDKSSLSAEDILKTLPSQKAYQAQQLIENYHSNHLSAFNTVHTPDSDTAFSGTETPESSPLKKPTPQPPKSIEELYSKPFKDKVNIQEVEFEDRSSGVESPPPPPLPPRMPSIKSSNKSNTQISVSSSNDSCFEANPPQDVPLPVPQVPKSGYIPMGAIFPDATPGVKLEHPKKPPRQRKQPSPNPDSISTKSHSSSVKSDELSVSTTDSLERSVDSDMKRHSSNYVFMEGISFEKTDSNAESDSVYVNSAEIKTAATKEQLTNDLSVEPTNETSVVENSRKHFPNYCNVLIGGPGKMEIEMAEDKTLDDESEVETNTSTDPQTNTSNDDSTVINGDSSQSNEGDRTSKPLTLDFCNKRTSSVGEDAPVSPTGYVQPPTPDQPPPSPSTALHGIHQKLNPQDKRKSKDMETLTDAILLNPGGLSDIPELFPGNNAKLQNIEKLDNEETLPSDNLQTVDKTTSDEKVVSDNMKSSISNEIAAGIRGDNSNQPKMRKTSSSSTSTGGSVSDSEVELNIFAGKF